MIEAYQFTSLPAAIVLWVVLYCADYYLTLYGNDLRAKYAVDHMGLDGSYELNPYYVRDIGSKKRVSGRFIFMLVLFAVWLAVVWYGAQYFDIPEAFSVAAGVVLLMEVPVLATHLQNISMYRFMKTPGAAVGKITYARWIGITLAGRIFGYWLIAYCALFLLTGSWLFVGGALVMLSLCLRYSRRGYAQRKKAPAVAARPDGASNPTAVPVENQ